MKSLTMCSTALLVVALMSVWNGWNDGWYLTVGLIATALPLIGLAIWLMHRSKGIPVDDSTPEEDINVTAASQLDAELFPDNSFPRARESVVVGVVWGVPLGGLLSIYLLVVFTLLHQVPWIYDRYYDSDRESFQAKLTTLEQAGNYEAAAASLDERLTRKTGREWRTRLVERLYRNLVQLASHLSSEKSLPVLTRACELADGHQLDPTAARTLYERAIKEKNLDNKIDGLRQRQEWDSVVQVLKSELIRDDTSTRMAGMLYDALCTVAARSESSEQQAKIYTEAIELADRYQLSDDRAQAALAQIHRAKADQNEQNNELAALARVSAEALRELLGEMLQGAAELSPLEARLQRLQRVSQLADQYDVTLPLLQKQLTELEAAVKKQHQLDQQIDQFRREKKYDEAIDLLVSAVRTTTSSGWIQPLNDELIACLNEWCGEVSDEPDLKRLQERLQQAVKISSECGLEVSGWKHRLEGISALIADREHIRSKIAKLIHERRFEELVAYLKVRMEERPEAKWPLPYSEELIKALVSAALDSDDLDRRLSVLREALETAKRYGRDARQAQEHFAATERKLRDLAAAERLRTTPVELPKGANAGFGKISTQSLPFVVLDVWVEDNDGKPLTSLEAKDFQVSFNEQMAPFFVQPVETAAIPHRFAILADISGSVAAELPAIKTGITQLAAQLAQDKAAKLKLIPFHSQVDLKLPWTGDASALSSSVRNLQAEGETALYRALSAATEELDKQPQPCSRHVLLFTDGKDSVGGLSLDEIVLQCRTKGVSISAIGLRTQELEPAVLKRLTSETGGQYFEAANASELGNRFVEAAQSVRRNYYRLAVDVGHTAVVLPQEIAVSIGSKGRILMKHDLK